MQIHRISHLVEDMDMYACRACAEWVLSKVSYDCAVALGGERTITVLRKLDVHLQ
jgi:hypothetical protein